MSLRRPALLAHLALLLVVAIWGGTFALVKSALRDCTPLLFNQVRMLIAFLVLASVNFRQVRRVDRRSLKAGAIVGVLLALGYELQTAGLARTTASKSAFLTGLVVVLVPLLAAVPLLRPPDGHRLHLAALIGASLAFGGIVLLTTPAGTSLANMAGALSLGDLLSLLCAVAFALHLLALAHTTRQMPSGQLATLQIGFCALAMSLATPLLERPHLRLTANLALAWAITAVLATALAFTVQTWSQQHLQASHTALLLALEPAFAWAISLLVLHEHLNRRSALGAALILSGLLVSELMATGRPVAEQPEANAPGC